MRRNIGNIFYTYSLTDPDSNVPFYIGKGYGERMYYHEALVRKGKTFKNKHLYHKISKIISSGKSIVYNKIIENVSESEALIVEQKTIKNVGRADLNLGPLCNLTDGGDGASGLIYSEQTKILRSNTVLGEENPMYGKRHTEESKTLISEKKKNRDKVSTYKHTAEHRQSLKTKNFGGIKTSKPIYQIDDDGVIVQEWPSARMAAKFFDVSHGNISYCATKKQNWKAAGFYWKLKV